MTRHKLLRRILWTSGALLALVLAFLVSVIFLNPSSVGNRDFLWNFNFWASMWAMLFVLVLVLAVVLARYLIRLFFEYQAGYPGSRIKTKLVLTFVIFALFPALIMAFLAFGLINQNLTTWVSAPSEQLLSASGTIAQDYYTEKQHRLLLEATDLSKAVRDGRQPLDQVFSRAHSLGFEGMALIDPSGKTRGTFGRFPAPSPAEVDRRVEQGEPFYHLDPGVNTGTLIEDRIWLSVPIDPEATDRGDMLLLYSQIPNSVAFQLNNVAEANRVYSGLKGTLVSLRITYILILTVTTLAVVFGFVWLGNYIARKLTVPLEALAKGSMELAEGNLDHRVEVAAVDELRILVDSFNAMADELRENRRQVEATNNELRRTNIHLDERRRYIEAVLQNIATGVITLDQFDMVRTANESALKMLQRTARDTVDQPLSSVVGAVMCQELLDMKQRAGLYGTYRKQLTIERPVGQLYVAATMTINALDAGVEYLVVLDDLTELIRAEKFAAWQEVARRLAHEIKNPLTPIQLSTERIERRFARLAPQLPKLPEVSGFQQVLSEASRIISMESRILKNLLSEFSRFARLPMFKPERVDLHFLLDEAIKRYDDSLSSVRVTRKLDPGISAIWADPEQLQRVFVNLIDNSLDALVDEPDRSIDIRTTLNSTRKSVSIEFSDTGHGIAAEDFEHLFLPYFSTKKKGTGLGLAIVRQIVSEHGGFIRAERNLPRGTRITMEIPIDGQAAHATQDSGS